MPLMEEKRVHDIALASGETIPAAFIRPEDEQPGITTVHGAILGVPIVDFSDANKENLVEEAAKAARDWGMFQVVNHGIPEEVMRRFQGVGKEFFALPREEKEVYAKEPDSKSLEGYGTKLQKEMEGKQGWVDHFFHKIWPPSAINYNFWPENPPSYRDANKDYAKHLHGVVDKLFKSLSAGLGLKDDKLKEAAGGDELVYLLKINYYPPCPRPDLALGVVPHTDMCALTILVSDHVKGLQAFRDGHWYDVNYIPNALVIHIGDQIEIMSNGKYKSVLHRSTVHKEKTRMSWPVFLEPPPDFAVGPHPELLNEDNSPKYKTKKYSDYVYCKLNKIPQ